MGRKKIDRTGEERLNSFGSKMVIVGYRNNMDIDVYFPKYNWTFEHTQYSNFKKKVKFNVLMNPEYMVWVLLGKVNIRHLKMGNIRMNIKYITK